jgi:hypothetical protein
MNSKGTWEWELLGDVAALAARTPPPARPSPTGLSGTFTGTISGNARSEHFTMGVTFSVVQSGSELAGVWNTTGGSSGTVVGVVTSAGIEGFKVRQLNPCPGEFAGVAVIEAAGDRLRGSYGGTDCSGALTAAFEVRRQ